MNEALNGARFRGQVAVVTGALGGIGLATARRLAHEGASVALLDLSEQGNQAIELCRADGAPDACYCSCDIGDERSIDAAMQTVLARFDRLDVVVNVAGMAIFKPIADTTGAEWRRVLDVNLLGAACLIRHGFRAMSSGKIQRGGAIVNVSSIHAVQTSPLLASYAAAKAALLSVTRTAAIEGRALGIRVNAVLPGAVDTPMLWSNPNLASGVETIDPQDVGKPEEIAALVAFLASGEASFVTGTACVADGGRLAKL